MRVPAFTPVRDELHVELEPAPPSVPASATANHSVCDGVNVIDHVPLVSDEARVLVTEA